MVEPERNREVEWVCDIEWELLAVTGPREELWLQRISPKTAAADTTGGMEEGFWV